MSIFNQQENILEKNKVYTFIAKGISVAVEMSVSVEITAPWSIEITVAVEIAVAIGISVRAMGSKREKTSGTHAKD